MRLIVSLILTLIVYSIIVFIFVKWVIFATPKKERKVFIHTAIIKAKGNKPHIKKVKKIRKVAKKEIKVPHPKPKKSVPKPVKVAKTPKKVGSKTNIERGGEVGFKDIFQNVEANVPTSPPKLQKLEMSRFKGETLKKVESSLNKVNLIKVEVSYKDNSAKPLGADKIDLILGKIQEFWYSFSSVPQEWARVNIVNKNGKIFVRILDTNLDEASQKKLIEGLQSLDLGKESFNLDVLLQTKVKK